MAIENTLAKSQTPSTSSNVVFDESGQFIMFRFFFFFQNSQFQKLKIEFSKIKNLDF